MMLVLQPLSAADAGTILALLEGTAVAHGGRAAARLPSGSVGRVFFFLP